MDSTLHAIRRIRRAGMLGLVMLFMVTTAADAQIATDRFQTLDEYLATEAAKFNLPGVAVVVTEHGQIVHERMLGTGMQSESAFLIGSCSKTITALATLIALDLNNKDINTPIQEVLPNLSILGTNEPLRIVDLLQHRSGLMRSQGFDALPNLASLERNGHVIELRQPPGGKFAYCNLNYSLLGLVVEKLSDQSFAEFVESHVFVPAGMLDSSCSVVEQAERFAPEYQYWFGMTRQVDFTTVPESRIPAGFIRCSAANLARLQIVLAQDGMLDGQQVFKNSIIQQMKSPPDESGFGYGMGVYRGNHRLGPIIAHEGATQTSYAFHGLLTEDDVGFVFLTNINLFDPFTDHGAAIYENIFRILSGEPVNKTYPIRIWVRWLVLASIVITIWQLVARLLRWRKVGWQFDWPSSRSDRISVALQFVVPFAVWAVVLRWTQTPLLTVFAMEPDLMWSFAFLTVSGMFTGCLRKCVPPEVFRKRPGVSLAAP